MKSLQPSTQSLQLQSLQIIAGRSHPELFAAVAKQVGIKLSNPNLRNFSSGEIGCSLNDSVRGSHVFVMQTHCGPVNEYIMEQAIMIDAAKRASAKRVIAVCPFFGYARQDRKASGREPITAKLIADILNAAGADRIMSIDLHSGQIQGFFNGPFDHLTAMPVLSQYIKNNIEPNAVIVSPDAGRVKTSERYATALGLDLAIVHKRRPKGTANTVEALHVIGDVEGRACIVIDDMIDTAGTICAAAEQLKSFGATKVYALATHGVLSGPAFDRINVSSIDKLVVTDTMPIKTQLSKKLEIVSVSSLLSSAIGAVFDNSSVSRIFGGENQL